MTAIIQWAKDVLSDPQSEPSERIHVIGLLASALVVDDGDSPDAEEARQTVIAFWLKTAVFV